MTRCGLRGLALLWVVVLFASLSATFASASEGGGMCNLEEYHSPFECDQCYCVGHCYCLAWMGWQMCTFGGRECYYGNKINIDGGPGNCQYWCCVEYNWVCELP